MEYCLQMTYGLGGSHLNAPVMVLHKLNVKVHVRDEHLEELSKERGSLEECLLHVREQQLVEG